ncbi:MAG: hypothetical protein LLG01_00150 [Planctomycetaceae bacterium]|nr:hypothetical protein [Planctomycetaceae bacterium]
MKYKRLHLIEKLRVQVAAAAALLAVYFWAYHLVAGADPKAPTVFFGAGAGHLLQFIAVIMTTAVLAGAASVGMRPSAGLLVTLVGAAGLSLHMPSVLPLLWNNESALGFLLVQMILDTLLLAVVVFGAALLTGWVRNKITALSPSWAWQDPLASLTEEQRRKVKARKVYYMGDPISALVATAAHGVFSKYAEQGSREIGTSKDLRKQLVLGGYCLALAILTGFVLLLLLMRSYDRSQTMFAVAGSLFAATLLAYQVFPFRSAAVAMVTPVVLAVVMYALGAMKTVSGMHLSWETVAPYACAVPLDWVTAGAAGAVAGYWVSSRIHEARYGELDESDEE